MIFSPDLTQEHTAEMGDFVGKFRDIFTDRPGRTNLIEHDIRVTNETPVRQTMYPTPFALKETIELEVKQMLDLKII